MMTLNNDKLIKLLRKIYILQFKKRISQKTLAESISMSVRDPRFREIIILLRTKKIIIEYETFSSQKLIEIRNGNLEKYIRNNSEDFVEWGKFIEISKPFSYSY